MVAGLTIDDALRRVAGEGYLSHFTLWALDSGDFQASFARTDSPGGMNREIDADPVRACLRSLTIPSRRKAKKPLDDGPDMTPLLQQAVLSGIAKGVFGGLSIAPTSTGEWKAAFYQNRHPIRSATHPDMISACLAAFPKVKVTYSLDEDLF